MSAAPFAVDTLRADESFFVMNATNSHQQIAVYQDNRAKSHERMTWSSATSAGWERAAPIKR